MITNDDTDQNVMWLICLKEIFSKQLPKMPKARRDNSQTTNEKKNEKNYARAHT